MKPMAILFAIALSLSILAIQCAEESPEQPSPPVVIQTSPSDGAQDVNLNPFIEVWFSQALDEASLDSSTFHVVGGVTHHIGYDPEEHKATLFLARLLEPDSTYEVFVGSEIASTGGTAMGEDYIFSFTTGPLDCGHVQDRFEPNDDVMSAVEIELNKTYTLLTSCGDEERYDFFKFTLDDTAKVIVHTYSAYADTEYVSWTINFPRCEGDYYSTIGLSLRPDRDYAYGFTYLPGTYCLQIGKYHADDHIVAYHLTVETTTPCQDDEFEDNDFIDEATPIEPGHYEGLRGCYVDRDFFSIYLESGQTLTVTATEVTSINPTRRLIIYGPDGYSLTGHTDKVNPAVESWTATEDTTYYFKIRWWADGIVYDLDVDVE